ncbi:hypothetical protein GN109_12185 [Collimonas pratensis]|uniref:hypothetical protein n=1 Tax=Collimonas pratensis TaxID=279113 RepID=UPI00143DA52D|nr:hypothetical protein [Collimonas pratensis]NKI70182.1 hypothetical protein [Collimonas pratensis]
MFIMKNLVLMSILGGCALAAAAQPAPDNQTVQITGPTLRIEAPSHYHRVRADEAYDYLRSYSLSNGMTLDLFYRGQQLYAEVQGQGRHAIVATSTHDFVALDRQLKMTINLQDSDDATGELIMVVPQHQLANGAVAGERVLMFAFR